MEFKISQIAEILSAEIVGNADATIKTVCKIEEGFDGGLTFLSNPKYTHFIYETKATAALVDKTFQPEKPVPCTLIKVDNAYLAFAKLLDFYNQQKKSKQGVSPKASVAESAKIGNNVYIGDFAVIGENVEIGDNTKIFPQVCIGDDAKIGCNTTINAGVKIYHECEIGNDCTIHANTVIGADGFGFAPQADGSFMKIPQIGNVVIEDFVEIGANTTIDRATMGSTRIRKHAKIDNLVQIAHNVEVGEGTAFAAQVGIAGSTKIGAHCMFGGQVGVSGHLSIGNGVMSGAQSGIMNNVGDGEKVLGSPAISFGEEKRLMVYRRRLPQTEKRLSDLEKRLKQD